MARANQCKISSKMYVSMNISVKLNKGKKYCTEFINKDTFIKRNNANN